jgi:hypothetical protein
MEDAMTVQTFIHDHYSPGAGESPVGHAVAVLTGLLFVAVGAVLAYSVVLLPLASVVGLTGLMMLGGGLFAHIRSPLTFHDLLDDIVLLAGAAIAGTFALTVIVIAAGLVGTAVFEIVEWLLH